MSSVIAMAYLSWAPDIHLGPGAARHIEEIRRLTSRMKALTNESERAAFEAQILYGVHVFARAKVIPDLAISRGEEAYAHAREIGDRALEFLAAGGTAMAYADVGALQRTSTWLERAAAVASEQPTPFRSRRLETWRGLERAAAGDAGEARRHLERAVDLATDTGRDATRCEALATLAVATARLGVEGGDVELVRVAEGAAREASELARGLPGHPPWSAQADAAVSRIALFLGDEDVALEHARAAMASLEAAMREDANLDILIPVAQTLRATDAPEWPDVQGSLQLTLAMVVQRTMDEDVRVRWLRGPTGRTMTELAGSLDAVGADAAASNVAADGPDTELLQKLVQGKTNREIAEELGVAETAVVRRLSELFARIGASSRAEATAFAFHQRVL
jgi:DNA-binding CsgD family transcriptional regulator